MNTHMIKCCAPTVMMCLQCSSLTDLMCWHSCFARLEDGSQAYSQTATCILWHFAPRLNHLAARPFPIVLGLWRRIIIHDDTLTRVLYDAERHLYLLIFDKLHFLALIRMWDTWGNCDVDLVLSLLQSSSVNIWRREKKSLQNDA